MPNQNGTGNGAAFPEKSEEHRPCRAEKDKKGKTDMVNKVRVNIAGTPYAIATTDPEKYIQSLAKSWTRISPKLLDDNGIFR